MLLTTALQWQFEAVLARDLPAFAAALEAAATAEAPPTDELARLMELQRHIEVAAWRWAGDLRSPQRASGRPEARFISETR